MKTPVLRPCAHCGCKHPNLVRTIEDNMPYWYAVCPSCGIRTMSFEEELGTCDSDVKTYFDVVEAMEAAMECATDTWNSRADSDCTEPCEDDEPDTEASSSYSAPDWLTEAMEGLQNLCDYVHKCAEAGKKAK